MWTAGRRDSTVFGVVDDTTTTKFANRACAVHGISLPVVVDKVVVVVLKFPNYVKNTMRNTKTSTFTITLLNKIERIRRIVTAITVVPKEA